MTLQAGTTFAGYQIDRLLGVGGMGEVYLAHHPHLPRQEALKVLADNLSDSQEYRQRFLAEADLACRLRHPNVVGVHDRGEYENRLWISMDYIDGRDLDETLRQEGAFPFERALNIFRGVASAVQDMHDNGLLHRDIKPANILLTNVRGEEKAYLTDFGIAREVADRLGLTATASSATMSVPYAAPERLSLPGSQLDRRVDVYGLGCVLYEMLTGRRAFQGNDINRLIHSLLEEYPPPPSRLVPGLSPEVDAVVFRSLAKDRDQRYRDAAEFTRALEAVRPASTRQVYQPQPPLTVIYRGEQKPPVQIDSERLSAYDRDRLLRTVEQTHFFQLEPLLPSDSWQAERQELLLTAINGSKTVGWQGTPPPPVRPLCQLVDELAPRRRSRKPWIFAGAAGVVILAAVAVALLILLKPAKPAIPLPPTALAAAAQPGAIRLTWTPPLKNADHYVVYRDNNKISANVHGAFYLDKVNDTKAHRYFLITVSSKNKTSIPSATISGTANLRNLNAAETAFVNRLPSAVVDHSSCVPAVAVENSAIDVAVDCDLLATSAGTGIALPGSVLAYHNVDVAAYNADVKNGESGLVDGKCDVGPRKGTWSQSSPTIGAIYCFVGSSGRPILGWTYDKDLVSLWIFGVTGSGTPGIISLHTYWNQTPSLLLGS